MNNLIKGLIFIFLALVCFSIAGYLVIVQHNIDQYGWFLFVGFLCVVYAFKTFE